MKFYYFNTSYAAENTFMKLRDIAHKYGFATLADLRNMHRGDYLYPDDSIIGWTAEMLCEASIGKCTSNSVDYLSLPDPIIVENMGNNNNNNQDASPEPIFITIHANELDVYDPDEIISSVLKKVEKIKDRSVNITIM